MVGKYSNYFWTLFCEEPALNRYYIPQNIKSYSPISRLHCIHWLTSPHSLVARDYIIHNTRIKTDTILHKYYNIMCHNKVNKEALWKHMECYKLASHGLPQPPCGWCREWQHNTISKTGPYMVHESRKTSIRQGRANQCNTEADRKLLHLTCSVTFSHMETLKLHRLGVVDHCGQVRMDVRSSTYIFIRCHPSLLIFYSDQALWVQAYASLSWWL